ncbi:MAG: hypothetical protein IKV59_00250 [Lachnospiraceae bacterium]|nr:hypothetical protein [Lachnospiraceae bacterium]
MITFFNRKNVYVGFDLKQFADIRTALSNHQIDYLPKVKNRMGQCAGHGTIRGRTGSMGISSDRMDEYEIFVHKKDYELAMKIIQTMK